MKAPAIAAILLALFVSTARAASWEDLGNSMYVDGESIQTQGNTVECIVRRVPWKFTQAELSSGRNHGEFGIEEERRQINCMSKVVKIMQTTTYNFDGSAVEVYQPKRPTQYVVSPDTAGELVYKRVCIYSRNENQEMTWK